jgi:hypothetical protein
MTTKLSSTLSGRSAIHDVFRKRTLVIGRRQAVGAEGLVAISCPVNHLVCTICSLLMVVDVLV